MAFLDETGLAELWSITKAKAMPTKETAALFGLGEDATVDEVLVAVNAMKQNKLPVGTIVRSIQADAADKLDGSWALCSGNAVAASDAPVLFESSNALSKLYRDMTQENKYVTHKAIFDDGRNWIFDGGVGCYADGYHVLPVIINSAPVEVGIAYTRNPLQVWHVMSFKDTGLSRPGQSDQLVANVSHCNGRWFYTFLHKVSDESYKFYLLTTTDITGNWEQIDVTPNRMGVASLNCSRVFDMGTHYTILYSVRPMSNSIAFCLYVANVDKQTLAVSILALDEDTNYPYYERLYTADLIDGAIYAQALCKIGFNDPSEAHLLRIDPVAGTFIVAHKNTDATYVDKAHPTNVIKRNGKYIYYYGYSTSSNADFGSSATRYWWKYASSDGITFSREGSSAKSYSNQKAVDASLIELDGNWYLSASGTLYPYDASTDTLGSSTPLARVLDTPGRFTWICNPGGTYGKGTITVAPDVVISTAYNGNGAYMDLYMDAVYLPTISESDVYNYIKLKE